MDQWQERVQHLEALRLEYGSVARAVGIILAARAALLITSATLIGTVTNMYFSGLSSFKLAKITATGDVISTLGNTPKFLLAVFIAMLIGLIVIAVFSFDDEMKKIEQTLILRGSCLEAIFTFENGLFKRVQDLEPSIQRGFQIARHVLIVIALGWASFFIYIGHQ